MSHVVEGLDKVGKHFGKCRRTAQRWVRAGMPRLSGGRYDLEQIEVWLKTARYLGATLRQMEADDRVNSLFECAVVDLRQGLQLLCESFVKARGKGRTRLIDRAVRDILCDVAEQQSLFESPCDDVPTQG